MIRTRFIAPLVALAAADWLTIQAKFWKDISENFPDADRYGVSVSTIVAQTGDLEGFRVGLMPTATFLCTGEEWSGGGGTLPLCVWLPDLSVLHPYAAIGPGFGLHDKRNDNFVTWSVNGGFLF